MGPPLMSEEDIETHRCDAAVSFDAAAAYGCIGNSTFCGAVLTAQGPPPSCDATGILEGEISMAISQEFYATAPALCFPHTLMPLIEQK